MAGKITWGRHPDYAGGQCIKLFKGTNAADTKDRKAQGFELRAMPEWMHPEKKISRILTEEDRLEAFVRAVNSTCGAQKRWQERAKTGLDDQGLEAALRYELGIAGGSGARDMLDVSYQGAGLKIWASWQRVTTCIDTPIFEGKHTMVMARKVYNIADPNDKQMCLF